jgi:signal transduction histidine kinase
MGWDIGLPTLRPDRAGSPLALAGRLFVSYLTAFAAIVAVAALAVHFAFVGIVEEQTRARLADVARAGMRSVIFDHDTMAIDRTEISNSDLLTPDEGLRWFDPYGGLLAKEGLTPGPSHGAKEFAVVMEPIFKPGAHQRLGSVVASVWNQEVVTHLAYLDIGLLAGALLAALGAAAGGVALARRAVRPVEANFQTLREFTDNASHDLRGPLTAIATTANAALRDPNRDPERDRQRFEAIADGANQMSRLTADLLLLATAGRSLEQELFIVDLADVLGRLVERYRPRFEASRVALDAAAAESSVVYGNPAQIERVVANLIDNALRYTPTGGRVAVDCRRQSTQIRIAVRDSGIGIAPENSERIFDRLCRVNPLQSPEGAGLGLAIARALARRHGGDVTVSSRVGEGSTFVAVFPLRPRQSPLLAVSARS